MAGIAVAAALSPAAAGAAVRASEVVPAAASLPGLTRTTLSAKWLRTVRPHGLRPRSSVQVRFRGRGRKPQVALLRVVVARNASQAARWHKALRARRALVFGAGAVVVQLTVRGPLRGDLAFALRRLVRARISAAQAQTPWTRLLAAAERDGRISPAEAVQAFSMALGPLPGARRRPHGVVDDGTIAVRWVLSVWDRLTAAQRAAVLRALNGTPKARAAAFTPDAGYQTLAVNAANEIRKKLGPPLAIPIEAGHGEPTDADAYAVTIAVDAQGNTVTTPGGVPSAPVAKCRIMVGTKGEALSPIQREATLAHEAFHCYQIQLAGLVNYNSRTGKEWDWLYEGSAEAVSCEVVPSAGDAIGWYKHYFEDQILGLFEHTYNANGFWEEIEDVGLPLWTEWPAIFQAGSKEAAYTTALGGAEQQFLERWGSSFTRDPGRGTAWDAHAPCNPPDKGIIGFVTVSKNSGVRTVSVDPYSSSVWEISSTTGALAVAGKKGVSRLSGAGGNPDEVLGADVLCVKDGGCECPDSAGGGTMKQTTTPYLATSAGAGGGQAVIAPIDIDEACKKKPPKNDQGGPDDGGGGYSNGDPHMQTFDGTHYEFQDAGEFVLARSTDGSFEVQARQEPYDPRLTWITVNTAIAMRVGAHRVGVYVGRSPIVHVDGKVVAASDVPVDLGGGARLHHAATGDIRLDYGDGSSVTVHTAGIWGLVAAVDPAPSRAGKLSGLLGNFDGDATNDVPKNVYGKFSDRWLVTDKTTLFDYAKGKSPASYHLKGIPPHGIRLTGAERRRGRSTCRGAGVKHQPLLGDCTIDVGVTGKTEFATAAKQLATTLADNAKHAEVTAWQRLSTLSLDYFEDDPSVLSLGGNRVLVAWTQRENAGQAPSTYALDSAVFTTSAANPVADLSTAQVVTGWAALDNGPSLWRRATGEPAIAFSGDRTTDTGDPFVEKSLLATLQPDGTWSAPTIWAKSWQSDPSAIAAGSELFVRTTTGSGDLLLYRGIDPDQTPVDIYDGNAYVIGPRMARAADGTVWIAWRSPVSNDADGMYLRPLDPVTGQPLGPSIKAPDSAVGGNSLDDRAAFACPPSGPCRLAYASADSKGIVTWAPGETTPTPIATADDARELRIAYDAAGGLWVTWWDHADQRLHVIHGDGRGVGEPLVLDAPDTEVGFTNILPVPGGALLTANYGNANGERSVYAAFVSG